MKAYVLHGVDNLCYEEVPAPVPASDEVLVRVMAAGICGSDIPRVFETGAHRHPLIPGHEFSGVVETVGSEGAADWAGKRVGIFPLIPCYECDACQEKRYEMCRQYSYLGSRQDGGFAEHVVVPVRNLIALPEGVSFEEAAMLEPMAVAVHAMRQAMPKATDVVAICGLGTIGLLLAMFLREAGIRNLLLIGNKAEQKALAAQLGVSEGDFCDVRTSEAGAWLRERTRGHGADVFFECVGRNETVTLAINSAAMGGEVVLVGNPASDMAFSRADYWNILRHQITVHGTWNSSFTHEADDDWHYVLQRLETGAVAPGRFITHRFALERLEEYLQIMRRKSAFYVKCMVVAGD